MHYLCSRKQCVVLDVPQDSISGPIFFVLFINDLPDGLNTDTNIALYANDTNIWRSIKSDVYQMQSDIDYLYEWSITNKMNFHPQKCKFVTVKHKPP